MFSHSIFCILEWSKLPFNQFLGPFLPACATDVRETLIITAAIQSIALLYIWPKRQDNVFGQNHIDFNKNLYKIGRNVYSYSFISH